MAEKPKVDITIREDASRQNLQPLYSVFHIVDYCSKGTDLESYTINSKEDARNKIGWGKGPAKAVEIGTAQGYPVYVTKPATTTQGTASGVTKADSPSAIGTPTSVGALNAGVNYTANQRGVTIEQEDTGAITAATTVAVVAKAIKVTLRRDGMAILATANEVRLAVLGSAAAMALLAGVSNTGDGTGLAIDQAATSLPFGSTGTMTVSGNPYDDYIIVKTRIIRSGTVGGSPNPTFQWTTDNETWSSEAFIPTTGIVQLKDEKLETGLTVTFASAQLAGDEFTFTVTGPRIGSTDLLNGMDKAIADPTNLRRFGCLTTGVSVNRTLATQVNTKIQDNLVFQNYFLTTLLNIRRIAEGMPGETEDQWIDALALDFLGFQSQHGLLQMSAGYIKHACAYTDRIIWRPLSFAVAACRAEKPVHEALFATARGTLSRVLDIDHDEDKKAGLLSARFVTAMTYKNRPGEYYLSSGVTMAPVGQGNYARQENIDILKELCRRLKSQAWTYIGKTIAVNTKADPKNGAIAGSIFVPTARAIENEMSNVVESYLFEVKKDANVSVSRYPDGERAVSIPLDYDYYSQSPHVLKFKAGFYPAPNADKVEISIGINELGVPL